MAMVGGGPGSFIGPVHRIAAELDREIELVAGAFSSDAERSREAGRTYNVDPQRAYADVQALLKGEAARADRADFISIVTPNYHHFSAAAAALGAGFPVIIDKPLTATVAEAQQLAGLVGRAAVPLAITYTYSGYPLVREARARVAAGALGSIRKIVVSYSQGWLAGSEQGKQAAWRVDPARAGPGGCVADIGVHAFQLAEFVTGLKVAEILSDLGSVVPGRALDDDCSILLRFENGARGVLLASQVEVGERNGLKIRVYGDKGGLIWRQELPNSLTFHTLDGRSEIVHAGGSQLGPDAQARTRIPGGHPEGYLEAFANLYRDFAALLRGERAPLLPDISQGVRGMTFIATAVAASRDRSGWTPLVV